MHVFLVTEWYGTPNNGVGILVQSLAEGLQASGRARVTVVVLRPDGLRPVRSIGRAGETIVSICLRERPQGRSVRRRIAYAVRRVVAFAAVRLDEDDGERIANFHFVSAAYPVLAEKFIAAAIPIVTSFHGSDTSASLDEPGVRDAADELVRASVKCTAVSSALAARVRAQFPFARSITVVHNGVTLADSSPQSPASARDIDVLFVGNLIERKGVDTLLAALAIVRRTLPGVRAMIVGDGPLRDRLSAQAAELGVAQSVEFAGPRPNADVTQLFATAKIAVVPSRSEPFGLVVVEAQACGACVVASATGGIPEIVQSEASGILCAPGDADAFARAIIALLDDDQRRVAIATVGQLRARSVFSAAACAARYADLYDTVLAATVAAGPYDAGARSAELADSRG